MKKLNNGHTFDRTQIKLLVYWFWQHNNCSFTEKKTIMTDINYMWTLLLHTNTVYAQYILVYSTHCKQRRSNGIGTTNSVDTRYQMSGQNRDDTMLLNYTVTKTTITQSKLTRHVMW